MKRREFLGSFALATAGVALVSRSGFAQAGAAKAPIPMTVYKSPSCGCCKEWVTHAQKNGFAPKVVDMADLTQVKKDAGVPAALESCHTVLVGAYVVEGHVPADLVHKMLTEKPAIVGLAVAGMVVGSPGMEHGNQRQPYKVTAWTKAGKTSVYARR
jgi:hypothetical protein